MLKKINLKNFLTALPHQSFFKRLFTNHFDSCFLFYVFVNKNFKNAASIIDSTSGVLKSDNKQPKFHITTTLLNKISLEKRGLSQFSFGHKFKKTTTITRKFSRKKPTTFKILRI